MANFEDVKDGKPITLQYMQAQKSKGAVCGGFFIIKNQGRSLRPCYAQPTKQARSKGLGRR